MKKKLFLIALIMLLLVTSISARDTKFGSRGFGSQIVIYPPDHPGKAILVDDSVSGASDDNSGRTWSKPLATIDAAINKTTANLGHKIYVGSGHAGSISTAAGIACDVVGIEIIGLGYGDNWPTVTLTAAAATVEISAKTRISGIKFIGNFTNGITEAIDITATGDGSVIENCWFAETSSTKELLIMITLTADADRITIRNNIFTGISGGDDSIAINLEGGSDETVIEDNDFYGDWSGNVIDATTAASTALMVRRNVINNLDTGAGKTFQAHASTTGDLIDNYLYGNGASFAAVGAAMHMAGNTETNAEAGVDSLNAKLGDYTGPVGGSGVDDNVKAATDHLGVDTDAIIVDATNSGTQILVTSSVTSSSIPNNTQTAGAITGAASGTLLLKEITINTGTTGWATPTNIEFSVDNTSGSTGVASPIFLEVIASFAANKTVSSKDATSHVLPILIESGSIVYIHGDDNAGTGGGIADVTLVFERVSDGATIASSDLP